MTATREVSFPEMTEEQRRVHRAGEALHRDGASPAGALDLLAALVEDKTWERLADKGGHSFRGRFRDFVEAKPPFGLGYDAEQLRKLLKLKHPHENVPKVADRVASMRKTVIGLLFDGVAEVGDVGRPSTEDQKTLSDNNIQPGSQGTRNDYIVSRLKRHEPDLAERVIAGELSPSAAARQMGWRKPTINVSTPERVAKSLRQHMTPADLARLAALLNEDEGAS